MGLGGALFALWSAVGLPIALAIGMNGFERLLAGAQVMDTFSRRSLSNGISGAHGAWWYLELISWSQHQRRAALPRSAALSAVLLAATGDGVNGKTVGRDGQPFESPGQPHRLGEGGSNGQHAFFQLLHQGVAGAM